MPHLFFRRLLNPATYALRQALRFRRAGYREGPLDLARVSPRLRAQLESAHAHDLEERYGLADYRPALAHAAYTKSLFVCDVFDRLNAAFPFVLDGKDSLRVLDVGSKNFEAAPGLYCAARLHGSRPAEGVSLTGIEIDAFPIYRNLHSRADAGHYYLELLPGIHRYLPGNVLHHTENYGLITWFFPFLTPSPALWWGLPERLLSPLTTFRHVLGLLAPGGVLILANYAGQETEIQQEMVAGTGLPHVSLSSEELIGRDGQTIYIHAIRT